MPSKECDRLFESLWERSDAWERDHSNDSHLWAKEPPRNRELMDEARAAYATDPAAWFRLYIEAAEGGSAWALEEVGRQYEIGFVTAPDFAKADEYYRRAVEAGSWMATLRLARFLDRQGRQDECDELLKSGVASDFVPASFWLAWLRYWRSPNRERGREIRPLLEQAASAGHPRAEVFLAQLMAQGKFGLSEIPAGLLSLAQLGRRDGWGEGKDGAGGDAAEGGGGGG